MKAVLRVLKMTTDAYKLRPKRIEKLNIFLPIKVRKNLSTNSYLNMVGQTSRLHPTCHINSIPPNIILRLTSTYHTSNYRAYVHTFEK